MVVVLGVTTGPALVVLEVRLETRTLLELLDDRMLVVVGTGALVVVVTWAPGKHWEYHSLVTTQVLPAQQLVEPVKPFPPHWALRCMLAG